MSTSQGRTRTWQEAKDDTIRLWLKVRHSLGSANDLELLNNINLICALCTRATEDRIEAGADPETGMCDYCPVYEQFGGCRDVCAEISDRVAAKDWDGARELADRFIADLRHLRPRRPEPRR